MNLDFSEDQQGMREQLRRMLDEHACLKGTRAAVEGATLYDQALWRKLGELGWLGASIPEQYGGQGLGHELLCVVAEEIGRAVAAVPFASSIVLAAEALLLHGSDAQKQACLPGLACGEVIGAWAHAERAGPAVPRTLMTRADGGRLTGHKIAVAHGMSANLFVVSARTGVEVRLFLVKADAPGVTRQARAGVDPSHGPADIHFDGVVAEPLGTAAWRGIEQLLERAAVAMAFEQLGTADAALQMARGYALERHAFGRPIGTFQAIKHKLAEVWMANELARANAYYAACALQTNADELPLAAATARVSAGEALERAARELIQVHGGIGVSWEHDAHLFYRRGQHLALALGGAREWSDRVAGHLVAKH